MGQRQENSRHNQANPMANTMTYSNIFSLSATDKKLIVRAFGFSVWAIALTTLAFINGCRNSYELGRDLRAWWEQSGHDWALAEIEPCIDTVKAVVAWLFGVERFWSVQQLPITLAANAKFWDEVCNDYKAVGDRLVSVVDTYLMGV